ncbi:MAG: cell division protein FtsQ, partial [Bacteroidales bacterium]|nr:cell division protein FtsQ [Bacteroidales bacterium]
DGELMTYRYSRLPVQVPLATGHISQTMATNSLYTLAQFLQNEDFWRNFFTQIYVESNGDIRLVPRVGEHTVLLGPIDNYEEKFEHLRLFYRKVLSKTGWDRYKTINLKYKGQVVAEKR